MNLLINADNSVSYASKEPINFKHELQVVQVEGATHLASIDDWAFCFYDPDTNTVISMAEYIAKYPEQFPDE